MERVYRIEPQVGKFYHYSEATMQIGHLYFADSTQYVGQYVGYTQVGFGDGEQITYCFNKNGENIMILLSYEGKSCFVECQPEN